MTFHSSFVKKLLEIEPSKPSKLGFEGFEVMQSGESENKNEDEMILDHIIKKTITEGSYLYQCSSVHQAKGWCEFLNSQLPSDRDVCVIRNREINTYTISFMGKTS